MKYALALILVATSAHAVNGGSNGNTPVTANAGAVAAAESVSGSNADASATAAGGVATAVGGDATATGGMAEGGQSNVLIREDYDAPAPSVGLVPPLATMECVRGFGIGGSSSAGGGWSAVLGPQWKDGDCMAAAQFKTLSEMNLYVPAAAAYCSRKRFVEPFGTREDCEAQVAQALIDADMPQEDVRVVYWPEDSQCRESLRRCEAVTK